MPQGKKNSVDNEDGFEYRHLSYEQAQTAECFGFKWQQQDTYESEEMKAKSKKWLLERYCAGDPRRLEKWLGKTRKLILDVGCGSGFSALLFFGDYLREHDYLGMDISSAVRIAKERFEDSGYRGYFLQADLKNLPIPDNYADIIFCEGVLHHTDSVEESLRSLTTKLKTGGRIFFYVYRKKAAIREFTDDFIRNRLKHLSDEESWEALKPLTKLGIALGKLNVTINVPQDIDFLGIKKGEMDIQRFFYWNICKLFFSTELKEDELNHINFDWFRPLNCHRHTPEEIIAYCEATGLKLEHLDKQEAGITVIAMKQ
jgi:SAM-dependent methyltransferase